MNCSLPGLTGLTPGLYEGVTVNYLNFATASAAPNFPIRAQEFEAWIRSCACSPTSAAAFKIGQQSYRLRIVCIASWGVPNQPMPHRFRATIRWSTAGLPALLPPALGKT